MDLDLRTMMVMISVLGFLFALLLGLASLHDRGIKGLKHWSLASLFISFGFGIAYTQQSPGNTWAIIPGAVFLATGTALQLLGIQAFKNQHYQWRILSATLVLVAIQSFWFVIIQPDVNKRILVNSAVFAALNFACAKSLLIPIKPPERTAYWLTGSSFALVAMLHVVRIFFVLLNPAETFGLYNPLPINPVMFFGFSLTQLFLTFGFILMVNYRMATKLENQATVDSLTGAWNRRGLDQEFQRLVARSLRKQESLSVLMLDVDYFKAINDEYGHQTGDEVLRQLVVNAKAEIRNEDYMARFGGEEFCILLPSTAEVKAKNLAERLRRSHESHPVFWDGKEIKSSISIGVACSEHFGMNHLELLKEADIALYRAKESGRNNVVVFSGG